MKKTKFYLCIALFCAILPFGAKAHDRCHRRAETYVVSEVDLNCVYQTIYTSNDPTTLDNILDWSRSCKVGHVNPGLCQLLHTAQDHECFNLVYRYAGKDPKAGVIKQIKETCLRSVYFCVAPQTPLPNPVGD